MYYRIHQDKVEEMSQRSEHHYLMIFDESFQVRKEFKLNPNYSLNYFPTENGVFFPIKDQKENYLSFGVIQLTK